MVSVGEEAVAIGPRLRRPRGWCPDAGAGRSGESGADGTGRAGTWGEQRVLRGLPARPQIR